MKQKLSGFRKSWKLGAFIAIMALALAVVLAPGRMVKKVSGQGTSGRTVKGQAIGSLLSSGGSAARQAAQRLQASGPRTQAATSPEDPLEGLIPTDKLEAGLTYKPGPGDPSGGGGGGGNGGSGSGRNVFVNDPCLDPPPTAPFPENFRRTVQSETEIAVLNNVRGARDDEERNHHFDHSRNDDGDDESEGSDGSGKLMVAGYNDSYGFYNNNQGLSGFSYSTNGGKNWIDGGGLPPIVKAGLPAGTLGQDAYFGDPVVQVHHRSRTFYYSSIYQQADGTFTLAVNRGKFRVAPQQVLVESKANTRCEGNPAAFGVPDPPAFVRRRIIWEPPVVAVPLFDPADFIDKEWLYVDQRTGELYLAYVRIGADGSTPLELVRSFDGGHTWTAPSVIVPNLNDTFNTGVQPITTPTGRVIVTWYARTFFLSPPFQDVSDRIEAAYSDNDGVTFGSPVLVANVNPQREPPGYNRFRDQILNGPYIAVDKGKDDGARPGSDDEDSEDRECRRRSGYGNVYITYFDGVTPLTQPPAPPTLVFLRAGEIHLSRSTNNGTSYGPEVKVNDDNTRTSHVFPSVQVNKSGTVFVTWLDRRVDPARNLLTDTWGAFSNNKGQSFGSNIRITDVSTDWIVRADAQPNFGDYNSSEVINFDEFASIWSDGRFPPPIPLPQNPPFTRPANRAATPDSLMAIVGNGAAGNSGNHDH
jgi:hypothetical protein